MTEFWQDVPGFGGCYEASSLGRVRSKARVVSKPHRNGSVVLQNYPERVLEARPNPEGYVVLHISVDGRRQSIGAHRLVALAFHGQPQRGQECCHNNGNPSDNRPDNLRWDSHLENNRDRLRHGNYARGRDHHQAKFTKELVEAIMAQRIGRDAAMARGVSRTQFYRLRKHGIDLMAEAERLANG